MDKLLTKNEISEMLGTSHGVAIALLSKYGIAPIDLGFGRGKGPRWLQSAVLDTMRKMHDKAQKQCNNVNKYGSKCTEKKLHEMSVDEIASLLTK